MVMYSQYPLKCAQTKPQRFDAGRGARWITWTLACALLLQSPASGQELAGGALLLKETDRVISGKISQRGEFYEVELAPDSRISIPRKNVAHVGSSIEELYQIKRRAVAQWSVGDHFQLTRWCLLNNLLAHAAEHYAETVQRSPDHPRVRQLGVELQERMLQDDRLRQYLGSTTPPSGNVELSSPTSVPSPASSEITPVSTGGSKFVQQPEIARHFTERVQPILLNRCSQAACHGAQSQQTWRISPPYATAAARITSENLTSALQQVSPHPNQESPLLRYATRPHGIQPAPAIAPSELKLIQELASWIAFVHNPVVSAVVTSPVPLGSQVKTAEQFQLQPYATAVVLVPVDPGAPQLRQVPRPPAAPRTAGADLPPFPSSAFPVGTTAPTAADIDALDAQLKAALGELPPAAGTTPVDPFDPAEFNRRFK